MNYIVRINYIEFVFDHPYQAINFATTAKRHIAEELKDISIVIKIDNEIKAEKEVEKAENLTEITEEVFQDAETKRL